MPLEEHLGGSVFALLYRFHCFLCAKKEIIYTTCSCGCKVLPTHMGPGKRGLSLLKLRAHFCGASCYSDVEGEERYPGMDKHSTQIASFLFSLRKVSPVNSPITEILQMDGRADWSHLETANAWCLLGEATLHELSICRFADTELTSLYSRSHVLLSVRSVPLLLFYQRGHAGLPGCSCCSMAHSW